MLGTLSASPRLHVLQLQNTTLFYNDKEPASLQPVILPELSVLDVVNIDPHSICSLLPMIIPQSRELSVRVETYPDVDSDDAILAIRSFLSRSGVSRLYIYHPIDPREAIEYLSAIPDLSTLILEFDVNIGPAGSANILAALVDSPEPNSNLAFLCPRLHTLYLVKGRIENIAIQKVIEPRLLLRKMGLVGCVVENTEGLLSWLKELGRDLSFQSQPRDRSMYWYDYLT